MKEHACFVFKLEIECTDCAAEILLEEYHPTFNLPWGCFSFINPGKGRSLGFGSNYAVCIFL